MDNGKISAHQFKVLVILNFIGTAVLIIPRTLASIARQDAWIAAVLGSGCSLLIVWFYNTVGEQLGSMTLVQYAKKRLGRWAGGLVAFFYFIFLFFGSASLLAVLGSFIVTQLMPETPILVVNALFMMVVMFGTRLGIEAISRSSEVLYPWAIGGLVFLLLFALPEGEFKNLQPVFESGIKPLIRGTVTFQTFTSLTYIILFMIFPTCLDNVQEGKKVFFKGTIEAGILIILLTLLNILVHGAESTARNVYPSYVLAKKISIGNFIERVEAILGMVWALTVFYKTILYFYSSLLSFAQTFELGDHRPFIVPFGMLSIILSVIIYPDALYAEKWQETTWISYILTIGFILPLVLLVIGKLRSK